MITRVGFGQLDRLKEIADAFVSESRMPGNFNFEHFKKYWRGLIRDGVGVIFVQEEEGGVVGVLGGVAYPDINTGELVAIEFFWYVFPESRGKGIKLLDEFELWAKDKGAVRITMVHLTHLMPEKVKAIYERRGYRELETHYIKEI